MTNGNRHFGILETTKDEVVIFGYNSRSEDVLIAVLSAMPHTDAQELRRIVGTETAQQKDYLMDEISGNVLRSAHHPNAGWDWQTFLLRSVQQRNSSVARKASIKDVRFMDETQKAFYLGYGTSIEPEIDARRKNKVNATNAMTAGQPIPEPIQTQAPAPAAAPEPSANDALVAALGAIAQGQQAILEKLDGLSTPVAAAPKTPAKKTPKKASTGRKPGRPKKVETVEAKSEPEVLEATDSE